MESFVKLIQERFSVRDYSDKPIEIEKMNNLKGYIDKNVSAPFRSHLRFDIIDASFYDKNQLKELGVYGIIRGPKFFIAGVVKNATHSMEDFGYCMEKNILMATSLDLGTCWLGGMLNRSAFANKLNVLDNEVIAAVTPIGYASDKKSLKGQALQFVLRSKKRKPFGELFFEGDAAHPLNDAESNKYKAVLDCVRLAPSAGNLQPWRIIKEKEKNIFHFYQKENVSYNRNKRYEGVRLQDIDLGIAMCHFEVVALELGFKGNWNVNIQDKIVNNLKYVITWMGND